VSIRRMLNSVVRGMVIIITRIWVGSDSSGALGKESSATGSEAVQASKTPPKDVYPESGFRLPLPKRDDLDDYGKKVYDKTVGFGSRMVAGLRGPAGIRLHSPKLAEHESALIQYLRYESGLSGRIRELAILVTAREIDNQFEWTAHEPVALKEGLPQEIIDIVKYRKSVAGLQEIEAVVIQFGRQMFGKKKVNSETFAHALEIFGPKELVNLVSLMTNYSATAALLIAFDMQLVPNQKPLLPLP
jgi:4-carboxymuconolactone decarboxylase